MIDQLEVVSIPVSDQDRAKAFYRDVFGFEVLDDAQFRPDMRWVHLRPPGARTSITLVTWFGTMPAGSLRGLVLHTGDLDAEMAALEARGVSVSAVESAPWGRYVTFTDPDGNGLVLQQ